MDDTNEHGVEETCQALLQSLASIRPIYGCDYSELTDTASAERAIAEAQLLQRRLAAHERVLCRYKNSMAPINRLPPELLSRIFKYCAPPDDAIFYEFTKPVPLFNFSTVCQRWRLVALNDPSLWVHPTCENRFLAEELPVRARGLPLQVKMVCMGKNRVRKVKLAKGLAAYFTTFSNLSIAVDYLSDLKSILKRFSGHAPNLKRLELRSSSPIILSYDGAWTISPSAVVTLVNCLIPFPSEVLRNLETLKIQNRHRDNESLRIYSVSDVLALLKSNTTLHDLSLICILKDEREAVHSGSREIISLPQLDRIELEGDPSTVLHLLKLIDMPALKYLNVHYADAGLWTELETNIPFVAYLQELVLGQTEQLSSLHLFGEDNGGTIAFGTTLPNTETHSFCPKVELGVYYPSDERKAFPLALASLLPLFPLENLTYLGVYDIGDKATDSTRAFWQVFAALEHLSEITIFHHETRGMLSSFLDELNKESAFPALSLLVFESIDMGVELEGTGHSPFKILSAVLESRLRRGGLTNLEEVDMLNCFEGQEEFLPTESELEDFPVPIRIDDGEDDEDDEDDEDG